MPVSERPRIVVEGFVVACSDQMSDLVGERVHVRGAFVMDDSECTLRPGIDFSGETAAMRVVHDQYADVGFVLIAECVDFVHVAVALVGEAENMVEMRAVLDVVRHISVREFEFHIRYAAIAKRLVGVFDRERDEVGFDIGVVLGCRLRVSDDQADCCGLERLVCR